MQKVIVVFLLLFISSYPQSIKSQINSVLNDKFFESCLVSVQVEDLTTNEAIYKKNEKLLLSPASNMKILTSAAALLYLGLDYEFKTDLYRDGYVSNDTLYGNIYVAGGCDPDFITQDLYHFVDALKSENISIITGNLYGDISFKDSLYWGKGWMWDDDPSSDAPHLSALNLNDNCIDITFDGEKDTIIVSPNTKFVNKIRIKNDGRLSIDRDWFNGKNEIIVKGINDGKNHSNKVNVLNPAEYFLTVFSEVLDSSFIKLNGNYELKGKSDFAMHLCSYKRKFLDVIPNLNKTSDNLSAEMTLYVLAEKYLGKPANADSGIKIINMMIDSLGPNHKNYRLVDGSGVSHYNVVSAELIVSILKYFYDKHPELYEVLYNSFPIAGVDGTLENRMRNTMAENNVHAKTGTLTGVSCLSGYLSTKGDHQVAFSIMMQNFVGSSKQARDLQDEICRILTEYK